LKQNKIIYSELGIDAAMEGNYQKALQCLLLVPVTSDIDTVRKILDDNLRSYKTHLPYSQGACLNEELSIKKEKEFISVEI